jgi:WD40 repeat protein
LPVVTALFSPDGNFVITGDRNGLIYLWDISN